MKKLFRIPVIAFLLFGFFGHAQKNTAHEPEPMPVGKKENNEVHETFHTSRIINAHSIVCLDQRHLDFRITHRFGDMAGNNGGPETLWGTDNAADIRIAFEYGISSKLNVGVGRSKGPGPLNQLLDGFVKYSACTQTTDNKIPLSIAAIGGTAFTAMKKSNDPAAVSSFPEMAHRFAYFSQIMLARKFGNRFSLQVMPTYVHRNFVAFGDENGMLSFGVGGVLQATKVIGLQAEYFHNLGGERTVGPTTFTHYLGFGLELNTGGHVFSINITNSRGIHETSFIPYTTSRYSDGQFRYGFTISRPFKV